MREIDISSASDEEISEIRLDYSKGLLEMGKTVPEVKYMSDAIEQIIIASREEGRREIKREKKFIEDLENEATIQGDNTANKEES